jgi:hypothetical protein
MPSNGTFASWTPSEVSFDDPNALVEAVWGPRDKPARAKKGGGGQPATGNSYSDFLLERGDFTVR